jgi:RNA polymerase sigma factor (sigma-70 family)
MTAGARPLLQYIHRLVDRSVTDQDSDVCLLNRFVAHQDEEAFAALVERHGALVLQVCRRTLGNRSDAEDAFQAVFIVLARKAGRLRRPEALPAWLHGVARRVALRARAARIRRDQKTQLLAEQARLGQPDPLAQLSARELLFLVDEEIQRLPEVYRLPVILCCLQGNSLEEAARQLGWTAGSVKGRLERGRNRLHQRLQRRGLTLAMLLVAIEVSCGTGSAGIVARLARQTAWTALARATQPITAGGISAQALALARQTLHGMLLTKLQIISAMILATGALTIGLLVRAPDLLPNQELSAQAVLLNPDQEPVSGQEVDDIPIEVNGHVFDPGGNPLGGARLYMGYALRRATPDPEPRHWNYPLRTTSAGDGSFYFTVTRSELDARRLDDAWPAVMAVADGYGPEWAAVGEGGAKKDLHLRLVEDLPVQGRILDSNRRPIAGAKVSVRRISGAIAGTATPFRLPRQWLGPLPGTMQDILSDTDGRFRLLGLGRNRIVELTVEGVDIPPNSMLVATRPAAEIPDAWRV